MGLNEFNEYIIGGHDLRMAGFIPGHASNIQNIAITGHLDLPVRTGKTHHVWPEEHGIEPYVRPEEIFFAGRDITIQGWVWGDLRTDLYDKIQQLNEWFDEFESEQELECKWGTRLVTIQKFTVGRVHDGKAEIKLHLRNARPDVSGELPTNASGGYGIDGYSWEDLGLIKLKTKGELNRGDSKNLEVSVYGFEKNRVKFHEAISIDLSFMIRKQTYNEAATVIQNFAYLLGRPYRRLLALEDGSFRECFAKDGFSVKDIRVTRSETFAFLDVKLTEIKRFKDYAVIGDNDGIALGDNTGEAFNFIV